MPRVSRTSHEDLQRRYRDPDRVRDTHVREFATPAEPVHGRGAHPHKAGELPNGEEAGRGHERRRRTRPTTFGSLHQGCTKTREIRCIGTDPVDGLLAPNPSKSKCLRACATRCNPS